MREHTPIAYREIWERKAGLRAVYDDIYNRIGAQMRPGSALEIGSGSGNLKRRRPETVSTDVQLAPWLDAVCDAQRLPFPTEQFDNVVMVDVLHHIEFPLQALREFHRVLRPNGRLIVCEPAITPLGGLFYRLFHDEPVDMSANPLAEGTVTVGRDPWLSNQAIPTLLTGKYHAQLKTRLPGLEPVALERFSFLAYPLSGGFQEWSLLPQTLARPLLSAEWKVRKLLGPLAAFRLLAVYQRKG